MKNKLMFLIVVIAFMQLTVNVFSQIKPFTFEGVKDYDNGARIAYFYIEGFDYMKEARYIEKEMLNLPEVKRFFIYEGVGKNRCMIEANSYVNEEFIMNAINKIILKFPDNYKDFNKKDNFPKFIDTGNPKLDNENYQKAKSEWIKN